MTATGLGASSAPGLATRPLVRLSQVEKRFPNGTVALQGMDLEIGEHHFISFLGPSGCGKSTAMRIVAGLTPVTRGELIWNADTSPAHDRTDRELGFVFQEPTLMPWANVFDNVFLPLRLAGVSRDEALPKVMGTLALVGLTRFAKVYPRELSGGMKMRVSIARALVTRPRLMLMDEPFAALDEMTRGKLNDDLLAIWREHRFTVIFVTHSVYEAVYLSNRIVVMAARPGRVISELANDEPYPRNEEYRQSVRYVERCAAVSRVLHSAMDGLDVDH